MRSVISTAISHLGFFDQVLFVRMHNGLLYAYEGVPRELYDWLIQTLSKGTEYNRKVKGKFPCVQLN